MLTHEWLDAVPVKANGPLKLHLSIVRMHRGYTLMVNGPCAVQLMSVSGVSGEGGQFPSGAEF